MLDILSVSKYILSRVSVTHKKLQRLCYYCQAWRLANYGVPMFMNRFEAWVNGPVSPDLYLRYREWGWVRVPKARSDVEIPCTVKEIVDKVLDVYGGYTDMELDIMSRHEFPWLDARRGISASKYCRNPISFTSMEWYYGRRISSKRSKYKVS